MIGAHIKKASDLTNKKYKTLEEAVKKDSSIFHLDVVQVFTHGPRSTKKNNYDFTDLTNTPIYSHSTYLTDGVWGDDNKTYHIIDMLKEVDKFEGAGLVLHLPRSSRFNDNRDIVKALNILQVDMIKNNIQTKLILEMPASAPNPKNKSNSHVVATPEKLNKLNNDLSHLEIDWGFCIDTAHQYACGVSFSTSGSVIDWFNELTISTKERIVMFHLNGISEDHYGTGKDVHLVAFSPEDALWGQYVNNSIRLYENESKEAEKFNPTHLTEADLDMLKQSGAYEIVKFCLNKEGGPIPIICEINRTVNYAHIHTLFAILHSFVSGLLHC